MPVSDFSALAATEGAPYRFVASHAAKYAQTSVTTMASVRREKQGRSLIAITQGDLAGIAG
jgi:hypothetical protein